MAVITELLLKWQLYLAVIVIFFVARIVRWWFDPLRNMPGPKGLPVLGNVLDYSYDKDTHLLLIKRAKEYGPVFKHYNLLTGTSVHISDPTYIKRILVTNSSNYQREKSLENFLPALGTGLLTTNGKAHAIMRKHLNPAFSLASVKDFLPIFNEKGNQLIQFWSNEMKDNKDALTESEMLTKFTHLTLDVFGLCGFGYSFNCVMGESSEESKATNTILTANFNVIRLLLETILPFFKYIPSKERNELKRAEKLLFGLFEEIIASRREEMKNGDISQKNDLLQRLINLYEDTEEGITNKGLFHQMFTFLVGGHDTTSLTLTWTVFLLAKHPEFQDRARKQIKEVMGDSSDVSLDHLDKLTFLDDCIKESMRLYPVAPVIGRESIKEDKLGPYVIPAKTEVMLLFGALQRDEKYWTNPDEYNPDRFSKIGEGDPLFPYHFLPFSRGPRMCIGYRFAQMEIKVVLAQLLNTFSFRLGKDQPRDIKGRLVLTYGPYPPPVMQICKI